jgi:hypothetical protein
MGMFTRQLKYLLSTVDAPFGGLSAMETRAARDVVLNVSVNKLA